jgi:hypothetical protein
MLCIFLFLISLLRYPYSHNFTLFCFLYVIFIWSNLIFSFWMILFFLKRNWGRGDFYQLKWHQWPFYNHSRRDSNTAPWGYKAKLLPLSWHLKCFWMNDQWRNWLLVACYSIHVKLDKLVLVKFNLLFRQIATRLIDTFGG